jgi:hypothetical protein
MGGVSYGTPEKVERDFGNDFIPIVEIDFNQIGKENSTKEWKYEGFEIIKGTNTIQLNSNLDSNKVNQPLHSIKITHSEVVVKFLVKQGNSKATDNDGIIEIRANGVNVLTKNKINIEYGKTIALRISTENIKENAFIDFYAHDDGKGFWDDMGLSNIHCGRINIKESKTCLVLYGSGWLSPTAGSSHNTGEAFKLIAEARNEINKKQFPNAEHLIYYCPTDIEFMDYINKNDGITRLDIYSHAWQYGLNLGGFKGKRKVGDKILDGDKIDWGNRDQDGGTDLRRVETDEDLYLNSTESSELLKISSKKFGKDCAIYLWGCNAGGQLSPQGIHVASNDPYIKDPKDTFAQKLAETIGKGNVFALVGKGNEAGSMFKTDSHGNNYYNDGEMIPANISANYKDKNTKSLNAIKYMKKFPL